MNNVRTVLLIEYKEFEFNNVSCLLSLPVARQIIIPEFFVLNHQQLTIHYHQ